MSPRIAASMHSPATIGSPAIVAQLAAVGSGEIDSSSENRLHGTRSRVIDTRHRVFAEQEPRRIRTHQITKKMNWIYETKKIRRLGPIGKSAVANGCGSRSPRLCVQTRYSCQTAPDKRHRHPNGGRRRPRSGWWHAWSCHGCPFSVPSLQWVDQWTIDHFWYSRNRPAPYT